MQAIAIVASQSVTTEEGAAVAISEGELEIGLECEAVHKAEEDHSYRGLFEGAPLAACMLGLEAIQHYSCCCFDKLSIIAGVTIAATFVTAATVAIAAISTTNAVVEVSIITTASGVAATTVEGFATVPTRQLLIFRLVHLPRFTKAHVSSPEVEQAFGA
jgi:hypothetical protein